LSGESCSLHRGIGTAAALSTPTWALPPLPDRAYHPNDTAQVYEISMARNGLGHWVPGNSANPGGRPGVPDVIKATLRELSPRAVERLGELLDSADERIQLEAAKAILDRHLGRPAIQADLTLRGDAPAAHLQALIELARKRRAEPVDLDDREIVDITPSQSDPK
jgi:hypothetical protein